MKISIIAPCRNERAYIDGFIVGVLAQQGVPGPVELLIADGRSDDGTRELIAAWSSRDPRVILVDNPERTTPFGLNHAIRRCAGEVVVRMDVHAEYAPDYVATCLETLRVTGADNVGGPARTRHRSYWQQAIAVAYGSPFSVGGARFHDESYEGPVDTVTYGCWRRDVFERIGLFDTELVRNQDDEFNLRLLRSGGRIWQNPAIRSWYFPRSGLASLFRQYHQYGYWKVRVIQKHRRPASWRHVVPGAALLFLGFALAVAPFWPPAAAALAAAALLYGSASLVASIRGCLRARALRCLPAVPLAFAAYHFGYGSGFVRGMVAFWLLRRRHAGAAEALTR